MKRIALLALVAACGSSGLSPQQRADRCTDFATAVAVAGLGGGTPSEQVARDVANSLDNRLARLGTPDLHTPAVEIHRSLHAVEVAQRTGDAAEADEAAGRAREGIAALAEACGVDSASFLTAP